MTETSSNPMKALYKRLSSEGKLRRSYLKKIVLPEWWEDSMAEAESGYAEGLAYIASHTGLLIDSMVDDRNPLTFPEVEAKYYLGGGNTLNEIKLATELATAAAALVAPAVRADYMGISAKASEIRDEILEKGAACVSFESLLHWCWEKGIGVLAMTRFPDIPGKMKAMITYQGKSPVIVLCDGHKYNAWQLFHLAHEIGHLALGHVAKNSEWIDAEISATEIHNDPYAGQENAATEFGVELITGSKIAPFHSSAKLVAEQVAAYAKVAGEENKVDAGFVALNHGWRNQRLPVSMIALRLMEEKAEAQRLMQTHLKKNLNSDQISDEALAYLLRLSES